MVTVADVKARLRISHSLIDTLIEKDIAEAKADMIKRGVSATAVNAENDALIDKAVVAYCLWQECGNDDAAEGYEKQWNQRVDELRKSSGYRAEE